MSDENVSRPLAAWRGERAGLLRGAARRSDRAADAGDGGAPRRGLSRRAVLVCLLPAALAVPVGARLLFWVTNLSLYREQPGRLLSPGWGDFSLFGGLILAAAVVAATCRLASWNAWAVADVLTPAVAVSLAVVRVGCFLRGCCFGIPSQVPWAVTYPPGSVPHLYQVAEDAAVLLRGPQPVHPTQFYECVAALIVAAIALGLMHRGARPACLSWRPRSATPPSGSPTSSCGHKPYCHRAPMVPSRPLRAGDRRLHRRTAEKTPCCRAELRIASRKKAGHGLQRIGVSARMKTRAACASRGSRWQRDMVEPMAHVGSRFGSRNPCLVSGHRGCEDALVCQGVGCRRRGLRTEPHRPDPRSHSDRRVPGRPPYRSVGNPRGEAADPANRTCRLPSTHSTTPGIRVGEPEVAGRGHRRRDLDVAACVARLSCHTI